MQLSYWVICFISETLEGVFDLKIRGIAKQKLGDVRKGERKKR